MKQKPPSRYFEPLAKLPGLISGMPIVMPPHDVVPLKIGVRRDWMQWVKEHAIDSHTECHDEIGRQFLSRLINSFDYKKAMLANRYRYDLSGNVAGEVRDQDRVYAQYWMDAAKRRIEAREASENTA